MTCRLASLLRYLAATKLADYTLNETQEAPSLQIISLSFVDPADSSTTARFRPDIFSIEQTLLLRSASKLPSFV